MWTLRSRHFTTEDKMGLLSFWMVLPLSLRTTDVILPHTGSASIHYPKREQGNFIHIPISADKSSQ